MELPFYLNFTEFQNNFKIDFVKISIDNRNISLIEYYETLQTRYENLLKLYRNMEIDLRYLKNEITKRRTKQLSNAYNTTSTETNLGTEILESKIQQFNNTYKLPLEVTILGNNISKLENFTNDAIKDIDRIIALLRFESRKQPNQFLTDEPHAF